MIWLLFALILDQPPLGQKAVAREIQEVIASPRFDGAFWGLSVYAPQRGRYLFEHQAKQNFRPASTLKILTTLAAFHYLGEDYRFQTLVATHAPPQDGVIDGDLIIRGGGDPSFSGRYTGHWQTADLVRELAQQIVAAGVHRVTGELRVDTSFFDETPLPASWEWDDVGRAYAVPISPLSLNNGRYDLVLDSDEHAEALWRIYPSGLPSFSLSTHWTTGEPQLKRAWHTDQFQAGGAPQACTTVEWSPAAWDPSQQFRAVLEETLKQEGVQFSGIEPPEQEPPGPLVPLVIWESDPLRLLARVLIKESQNLYADNLLKTLAAEVGGKGSFADGTLLLDLFLEELGVSAGQQVRDGSGLSAQNNLQPHQLTRLLAHGLNAPYRDSWLQTLAIMGRDGTLKERGDGRTRGRVWAKTGTINRTRNLAGYLETEAGETLIFTLMVNNYACPTAGVETAQDEICAILRRLKPTRRLKKGPHHGLSRILDAVPPYDYPLDATH